jgi:hypothetical protein
MVGLERGPLSFVSTIEELLGRNSSGFSLENREYSNGDPLRWPRDTLYPQTLTLTMPATGSCSVGIVCSWTKATGFFLLGIIDVSYDMTSGLCPELFVKHSLREF